jgi:CheY-like chemotaxis protein
LQIPFEFPGDLHYLSPAFVRARLAIREWPPAAPAFAAYAFFSGVPTPSEKETHDPCVLMPGICLPMKKIILLAEDSPDDELFFKRILRLAGVENEVHVVRDGNKALAYLKGDEPFSDRQLFPKPDVLFLDISMPPADGWQVLQWLQTQTTFRNMLVVVLTNYGQMRRLTEAYQLGASTFLLKPFNQADLQDLMRNWPTYWTLAHAPTPRPPPSK